MDNMIKEALDFYNKKEFEKALNVFEKILEHSSATPAIYNNMAMCYFNIPNFDKATEYFIKALSLDNKLPQAYINLSDIYFRQKRYLEAIELLQNAVYYLPDVPVLKHYLARVYMADSRLDLAIPMLDEVLEKDYDNYDAHWDFGRVCFDLGDYAGAIEHFEKVIEGCSNNELIFYQLGQAYEANDELSKALSNYLKAATINEKFHPAFKKIGLIFYAQGDLESAKEYLQDYLELMADEEEKTEVRELISRINKKEQQ